MSPPRDSARDSRDPTHDRMGRAATPPRGTASHVRTRPSNSSAIGATQSPRRPRLTRLGTCPAGLVLLPLRAWRTLAARARLVRGLPHGVAVRRVVRAHARGRFVTACRAFARWLRHHQQCARETAARRAALFVGWKPRCPLAPVQAWY